MIKRLLFSLGALACLAAASFAIPASATTIDEFRVSTISLSVLDTPALPAAVEVASAILPAQTVAVCCLGEPQRPPRSVLSVSIAFGHALPAPGSEPPLIGPRLNS